MKGFLPPLAIDPEVVDIRDAFTRALLNLHKGMSSEVRVHFWGRDYHIVAEGDMITVTRITPGIE